MTLGTDVAAWRGRELVDSNGEKVGTIDEIFVDDSTGEPEWLTVNSGLFGTKVNFVPLVEARPEDDAVRVPYAKTQIKDAPGVDADQHLSQEQERDLYSYYGLVYSEQPSDSGLPQAGGHDDATTSSGQVGRDVSGPTTDDAMTRSEEELQVGTAQREAGKARLRKYVVTEQVQTTVPVQHEEVRLEREPITETNVDDALDGPAISEEEHEVTLHEEQVVVGKQAVPKERVRLDTETVTEQETVSEEVRKEQIAADGVDETRR